MDRDGASLVFGVKKVRHKGLDVSIENDADQLAAAVHHRAARIAANDIGGANKVEGGDGIQILFGPGPTLRQVERRLVVVVGGALIKAAEGGFEGDVLFVLLIALYRPKGQPQSGGGVRVMVRTLDGVTSFGNFGVRLAYGLFLGLDNSANGARGRVDH